MKLLRWVAAPAVAVAVIAGGASPASAEEVGVIAFTGTATVTPGIGSPVQVGTTPPTVRVLPAQANGTWSFTSSTCSGTATSAPKPNKKNGVVVSPQQCTIGASGTLGAVSGLPAPYCGISRGSGGTGKVTASGTWVQAGPPPSVSSATQEYGLSNVGWAASAGGLIVFTGTATKTTSPGFGQNGPLVGAVVAVPTGGSCLGGDATSFTIVGGATYALINK